MRHERSDGCDKCGKAHPKCYGHKRNGDPCGMTTLEGQRVCKMHGGKSPGAVERGQQVAERERQAKALAIEITRFGDETFPETDPLAGIMRAVNVAGFCVEYLRLRVSELEDVADGDKPHVLMDLLRLWTKELARASKAALDVGVKEQQLRIFAQQVQLLADVVRKVFDDPELGLSPKQRDAATRAVGRHLRAVDDVA